MTLPAREPSRLALLDDKFTRVGQRADDIGSAFLALGLAHVDLGIDLGLTNDEFAAALTAGLETAIRAGLRGLPAAVAAARGSA